MLKKKFQVLGGCCLLQLICGFYYSIGNINPYLAAYFNSFDSDITLYHLALLQAFASLFLSIGAILGPLYEQFSTTFKSLAVTSSLMVCSFLIASILDDFYIFSFIFASIYGLNEGAVEYFSFRYSWRLFEKNQGKITGLLYMFFAGSPILLNIVENKIVNPYSKSAEVTKFINGQNYNFFDQGIYMNVPKMFVSIGVLFAFILYIALTLISYGQENIVYHKQYQLTEEQQQYQQNNDANQSQKNGGVIELSIASQQENKLSNDSQNDNNEQYLHQQEVFQEHTPILRDDSNEFNIKSVVFSSNFLLFYSTATLAGLMTYYLSFCFKDFALNKFPEEDFKISFYGGIASFGHGIGRFIAGFAADKWTFHYGIKLCLTLQTIATVLIYFAPTIDLFGIFFVLIMLSGAGSMVFSPVYLLQKYGVETGTKIFPYFNTVCIATSIITFFFQRFLQNLFGFLVIFWLLGFIGILTIGILKYIQPANSNQKYHAESHQDNHEDQM